VVGYLSVIRGVEGGMAKLGMGAAKHPALERAERLLRSVWRQVRLPVWAAFNGGYCDEQFSCQMWTGARLLPLSSRVSCMLSLLWVSYLVSCASNHTVSFMMLRLMFQCHLRLWL
jgi:hypothetical protein